MLLHSSEFKHSKLPAMTQTRVLIVSPIHTSLSNSHPLFRGQALQQHSTTAHTYIYIVHTCTYMNMCMYIYEHVHVHVCTHIKLCKYLSTDQISATNDKICIQDVYTCTLYVLHNIHAHSVIYKHILPKYYAVPVVQWLHVNMPILHMHTHE